MMSLGRGRLKSDWQTSSNQQTVIDEMIDQRRFRQRT